MVKSSECKAASSTLKDVHSVCTLFLLEPPPPDSKMKPMLGTVYIVRMQGEVVRKDQKLHGKFTESKKNYYWKEGVLRAFAFFFPPFSKGTSPPLI